MFVYDALGSAITSSDVPKCAKGVTYTDGPKYLPGLGASTSTESKTNWVPVVVGAAVVGAVVWWATSSVGKLPVMAATNPRAPTAEQWNKLRADYLEADRAYDALDIDLSVKYGKREWASRTEQKKLDQLRKRKARVCEKMFAVLDKVATRDWHHGVPAYWVCEKLSWEDAIRPANEPLSVTPPTVYGY